MKSNTGDGSGIARQDQIDNTLGTSSSTLMMGGPALNILKQFLTANGSDCHSHTESGVGEYEILGDHAVA
ncbi:MAG: hypothetical protein U0103_05775 [Candidatus Obscuribacterales bacterium]